MRERVSGGERRRFAQNSLEDYFVDGKWILCNASRGNTNP